MGYHFYLISNGITTNEDIKRDANIALEKQVSSVESFRRVFLTRLPPSQINLRSWVSEDYIQTHCVKKHRERSFSSNDEEFHHVAVMVDDDEDEEVDDDDSEDQVRGDSF